MKIQEKLNDIKKASQYIAKIPKNPAVLVFLTRNNYLDLSEKDYDKEAYIVWRNRMINFVLTPLRINNFSLFLPYNFELLLNHLNNVDMLTLLKVAENIKDIEYDEPIGSARRLGWKYVIYDEKLGISEEDFIKGKIKEILDIPNPVFSYYDLILYEYWHKRGGE